MNQMADCHELYEKYAFYNSNIVSADLQVLYLFFTLLLKDNLRIISPNYPHAKTEFPSKIPFFESFIPFYAP